MARPRSDDKRSAILSAAIRVIAAQGLAAPTAAIAAEAGVSNGSLFTYFPTKGDLLNQLYIEIKTEMGAAALDGLPTDGEAREQLHHIWTHWLAWATTRPEKRRALAHLSVSEEVALASHQNANQRMAGVAKILERARENGPMGEAPLEFVVALMSAMADATIDFMIRHPDSADQHGAAAFEAMWRMLA